MTSTDSVLALTPEQKYEFDLRGYLVLKGHYDEAAVAEFHAGIDELSGDPRRLRDLHTARGRQLFSGRGDVRPGTPLLEGGSTAPTGAPTPGPAASGGSTTPCAAPGGSTASCAIR